MAALIYKTKNYDLIARLDRKIFGKEEAHDEDPTKTVWFIVVADDRIAGFAGLTVFTEDGVRCGYLERAGLLKPFRGRGLQRDLIAVRDREAKRLGLAANYTYTARDNYPSSNNLIASGYRLYDSHFQYGLKGCLYWYKPIKGGMA